MQLLLEIGADIEATDNHGQTPLWMATQRGKVLNVELLLKHKADVGAANKYGSTILHGAAGYGRRKIVKLLLDHGADIEAVDCAKQTALDVAIQREWVSVVKLLLNHKADLDASNVVRSTSLHVAAEYGHESTVHLLLLRGGANTEVVDRDGRTAQDVAAQKGRKAVVKLLLDPPNPEYSRRPLWSLEDGESEYDSDNNAALLRERSFRAED